MDAFGILDSVVTVLCDGVLEAAGRLPGMVSPAELAQRGFGAVLGLVREHLRDPADLRRALEKGYQNSVRALEVGLRGPGLLASAADRAVCSAFRAGVLAPFLVSERGRAWAAPAGAELSGEALRLCRAGARKLRGQGERLLCLGELGDAGLLETVARSADLRDAARLDAARRSASERLLEELRRPEMLGEPHPILDLLRFEDVLGSGLAFYFHEALKADERLSQYVAHLDLKAVGARIDALAAHVSALRSLSPEASALLERQKTHEEELRESFQRFSAGLERYRAGFGELASRVEELSQKLDEVSEKLDAVLETSVETHLGVLSLERRVSLEFEGLRSELRQLAASQHANPALRLSESFWIRAVEGAVRGQLESIAGRFVESAHLAAQAGAGREALALAGEIASVSAQLACGETSLEALRAGEEAAGGVEPEALLAARLRRLDALLRAGEMEAAREYLGKHPEASPFPEGFELVRVLGAGGMGAAWLCRKPFARGRPLVVLKTLWETPGSTSLVEAEAEGNFAVEDERVLRIDCVHRGTTRAGRPLPPFLEMEYFDAPSLESLLRSSPEGRLPREQALALGTVVAWGLAAIHRAGIVHLDVKPGNVLARRRGSGSVEADWEIRIIDFGLAGSARPGQGAAVGMPPGPDSTTSELRGSLGYAAPEQMDAELARRAGVGPWSDVYGWGKLLYALLTGDLSARGWSRKTAERFGGRETLELLDACLEHNPEERLRSMAEVLGRLPSTPTFRQPPPSPPPHQPPRRGSNQRR